jgi:hypothetical protein
VQHNSAMERVITLRERADAAARRRQQAVAHLRVVLIDYARAHGGRFLLFGSAARGEMCDGSDVDILTDFPRDATGDAWAFAEDACREAGLSPDIRPMSWCGKAFLEHVGADIPGAGMSDLRWQEIDADVASAVRHFATADRYYAEPDMREDTDAGHKTRMAFMHSMQAGHTSLEPALIRILALVGEPRPSGEFWHADLIRRASRPEHGRPEILPPALARAADQARRFRHVAVRTYDTFEPDEAAGAVSAARLIAEELPAAIVRFRQAIDP